MASIFNSNVLTTNNTHTSSSSNSSSKHKVIDKIPINVNGTEKYATGLTKTTTIDEIKYAMLAVSDPKFKPDHLNDYGIFEKWQGNERLLDGKIKIHKLIRLWQSLPGDQLSQVQFYIKKRKHAAQQQQQQQQQSLLTHKLSQRDSNIDMTNFKYNMISPLNLEKSKRKTNSRKQLNEIEDSSTSSDSYPSFPTDSDSEEQRRRYASIKRNNRSKKSSIKRTQEMKKSFIELVNKQNEIIDKQLEKIANLDEINKETYLQKAKRQLSNYVQRSKSSDKCDRKKQLELEINEDDLSNNDSIKFLNDSEIKEYAKVCTKYFKVQSNLNDKLKQIDDLKSEIKSSKLSKKLLNSIETQNKQNEKMESLSNALTRIDDIINLKTKFIETLEDELKRLEDLNDNKVVVPSPQNHDVTEIKIIRQDEDENTLTPDRPNQANQKILPYQYSTTSTSSTLSSTSSVFTSISSISTSNLILNNANQTKPQMTLKNKLPYNCNSNQNDNESDTGISSANSEDFSTPQLETLV